MSTSETITRTDLTNILNEVLPSPTMLKTITYYDVQITWYSTSNAFAEVYTDISVDGWTPIDLTYSVTGSLSSYVYVSQCGIIKNNNVDTAHGYFRLTNTPSSTTQNKVNWTVTYIKNAPMVAPMADYIVEQGTNGIWTYRKWNSGIAEAWGRTDVASTTYSANGGLKNIVEHIPSGIFNATPKSVQASGRIAGFNRTAMGFTSSDSATQIQTYLVNFTSVAYTGTAEVYWSVKGTWK